MVASWACEVIEIFIQRSTEEAFLFGDWSDLTSPNSNHTYCGNGITLGIH